MCTIRMDGPHVYNRSLWCCYPLNMHLSASGQMFLHKHVHMLNTHVHRSLNKQTRLLLNEQITLRSIKFTLHLTSTCTINNVYSPH